MFHLTKQYKLNIKINNFHCLDYFYGFNSILDKVNLGLFKHIPIILNFKMENNYFCIICNLNESYIINMNTYDFDIEKISLEYICKNLYNDLFKQQNLILELLEDKDKEHFVLSLQWLNILLNQENFKYKQYNINQTILDALNNIIESNTINCIYDSFENIETFRILSNEKNFLILNSYNKQKCKTEFIILNENIEEISKLVLDTLKNQKKLKLTFDKMEVLKSNLKILKGVSL